MSKIESACKLLQDIEVVEREEEGRVTRTFLRKVLELLDEVESREEFIVSIGYIVARKKGKEDVKKEKDVIKFFKNLRNCVKEKEGGWSEIRNELKDILEYAIKIYMIKAELGEDLCTKR